VLRALAAVIIATLDFNLGTSLLITDTTVGAEPEVLGAISITLRRDLARLRR
jgi:hypothetical protein